MEQRKQGSQCVLFNGVSFLSLYGCNKVSDCGVNVWSDSLRVLPRRRDPELSQVFGLVFQFVEQRPEAEASGGGDLVHVGGAGAVYLADLVWKGQEATLWKLFVGCARWRGWFAAWLDGLEGVWEVVAVN